MWENLIFPENEENGKVCRMHLKFFLLSRQLVGSAAKYFFPLKILLLYNQWQRRQDKNPFSRP
jgi:hypothetical protein